jgi:serine protease
VRYGVGTKYATKTLTGPVSCSNSVFGDPAYGYVKHCDYGPAQ